MNQKVAMVSPLREDTILHNPLFFLKAILAQLRKIIIDTVFQ